jgi:hypothetical protein
MMSAKAPQIRRDSVSVVLNVFKRSANYEAQLAAIAAQTHPVTEILVWENGHDSVDPSSANVHARSSKNLGVWARFAFALNATSDFIWMIDDDSIPGPEWLASALDAHYQTGGLIGSRGLRFRTEDSYTLYDEFGPNNPNSDIVEVDIVGHNWIFPRSWLTHFWSLGDKRFNDGLAGEDIHLSFSIQQALGAGTFVPPHPHDSFSRWGESSAESANFGKEKHAISASPASMKRFEQAFAHYISVGFRPLCIRDESLKPRISDVVSAGVVKLSPLIAHKIAKFFRLNKGERL